MKQLLLQSSKPRFSCLFFFVCVEDSVSWPIRDRSVLLSVHWISNKLMWSNGGMMINSGKLECLKINLSQCHLAHKTHTDYPRIEPAEKPSIKALSYAQVVFSQDYIKNTEIITSLQNHFGPFIIIY